MKYLLALLLLTGCSLQHGDSKPQVVKHLNIVNPLACAESLKEASQYLASHGIILLANVAATKTLVCLPTPSWLMRNLSPVSLHGMADPTVVWAIDDAKVILHELGHVWGLEHGNGLMSPVDALQIFASGFTDEQLKQLKE